MSDYWRMVIEINDYQKSRYVERVIKSMFNTVSKKKIAVSAAPQATSTWQCGGMQHPGIRLDSMVLCIYVCRGWLRRLSC